MARKKPTTIAEFALFDVLYEDGTRSSNRKVPNSELGGLDGDAPALDIIEAQDSKIGELSGAPRPRIASLSRSILPKIAKGASPFSAAAR
ncbi:MAG TPA: hypothetical protein VK558_18640 [Patescibacteria group bacterium]|nr:hypothetical protein [Patescibacteria group bacterium]